MLRSNEIVKEQIFQTALKNRLRPSEKETACVPHSPYVRTEDFVRSYGLATAYL